MTLMLWLLTAAALAVTFANGANDNFKGVATLFGGGTTNYRRALLWGTVSTLAGSLAALGLASSLVARFSGRGLVPEGVTADPAFLAAVAAAAASTVLLATRMGFPISTTHALMGGLAGAGTLAARGEFSFAALHTGFVAPLVMAPLVSASIVALLYAAWRPLGARWPRAVDACVCVAHADAARPAAGVAAAAMPLNERASVLITGSVQECRVHGASPVATAAAAMSGAHYLSAGAVGFARGVNDAPKLVALLLPTQAVLSPGAALVLVAGVMAIGGLLAARRVAETLSCRVTRMTHGDGLLTNVTTAALVIGAARLGLPVSTTHISTGAIIGMGAATGGAHWKMIAHIALAWVVTVPCSAVTAATLWWLLRG